MTAEILKGKVIPANEPIRFSTEGQLFLNERKAEQLGIRVPVALLEQNQLKESKE